MDTLLCSIKVNMEAEAGKTMEDNFYSVSREFSIRFESGDELTVNRYQSKRIEICVMDKCE
ncbi:hypothetical protein [Vibrio sp. 10N.239.312.D08]|uniref:hypothetical protein n=1 Tax=Vibrio sp. 10N.239.312.D08 TaxID=3229978 RepID=UPI0035535B84